MIGMQAVLVAVLAVEGPSRRKTRRIRILQHRVTHLILIIFSPSFWQRKSILTEVFNPLNDCLVGILIIAPPAQPHSDGSGTDCLQSLAIRRSTRGSNTRPTRKFVNRLRGMNIPTIRHCLRAFPITNNVPPSSFRLVLHSVDTYTFVPGLNIFVPCSI